MWCAPGEAEDADVKAALQNRWTSEAWLRFAALWECGEGMRFAGRRFEQFDRRASAGAARGCSGQTVVEVALLLPLLLLLLVGVIEIGRYAYFDILISNAARAGAQYGAQSLIQAADVAGIRTAAQNDGLAAMTITRDAAMRMRGGCAGRMSDGERFVRSRWCMCR